MGGVLSNICGYLNLIMEVILEATGYFWLVNEFSDGGFVCGMHITQDQDYSSCSELHRRVPPPTLPWPWVVGLDKSTHTHTYTPTSPHTLTHVDTHSRAPKQPITKPSPLTSSSTSRDYATSLDLPFDEDINQIIITVSFFPKHYRLRLCTLLDLNKL